MWPFWRGNVREGGTLYYPVYMSGFFTNKMELPVLEKIEDL